MDNYSQSAPENRSNQNPAAFPKSILAVSRKELCEEDLTIEPCRENLSTLPADLHGHVFIIAPVGSVASPALQNCTVLPSKDGWTPLLNGDGMVYRLDFQNGRAKLSTRLIKTPCYYADEATHQKRQEYPDLQFEEVGITRIALNSLGVRNQVNTAFVPVKFDGEEHHRLLVTWDVGRPYEIDPVTLKVLTPVGWNQDWRELTPLVKPRPFKQVMSSAHPCYDPNTKQLFTVNVGKSLHTLVSLSRSLDARFGKHNSNLDKLAMQKTPIPFNIRKLFKGVLKSVVNGLRFSDSYIFPLFARNDYVDILLWDGKKTSINHRWQVLLSNGRPLKIEQTLHQMGMTKNYIILADTGFKFLLEHFLPYQKSQLAEDAKILFADLLDYPQLDYTKVYLIPRSQLKSDRDTVTAKEVKLPYEMAHYLADYEDFDGSKITLHLAHNCASDPAEFIRIFDRSIYDDRCEYDEPEITLAVQKLAGMVVGPMDTSRIGCYVIDANRGEIEDYALVRDRDLTWATAFYAYRDAQPTEQFSDLYWSSWGCWQDILTKRTVSAYENYQDNPQSPRVPASEAIELTKQGVPASICHFKIDRSNSKIDLQLTNNCYQFPDGYLGTSPQFVPRNDSESQTDGYIVCVVLTSDRLLSESTQPDNKNWSQNSEIWIFDAQDLNQGPLFKLSHPKLNFGFTLHTTWLEEIVSPVPRAYDIEKDHKYLIEEQSKALRDKITELFEKEIYPQFK